MDVQLGNCTTFVQLREALDGLPDQVQVTDPYALAVPLCEGEDPFQSFLATSLARPLDIKAVEAFVAQQFGRLLDDYFSIHEGTIFWQTPFETSLVVQPQVVAYDDEGEDFDFRTNQRCRMDWRWYKLTAFCRLRRGG